MKIGNFCSIARGACFMLGGGHRLDWATTYPFGHIYNGYLGGESISGHPYSKGDIVVGHDVWLGRNSTLMSGITLGHGSVIAANSTVAKSVGNYEVWGGNPARTLKDRFDREVTDALINLQWWELNIETIREIAPLLSQTPTLDMIDGIKKSIG